jgi:uncharacterized damage-inducible protein DinB
MADGTRKPIEQIRVGDKVLASDPDARAEPETVETTIVGQGTKEPCRHRPRIRLARPCPVRKGVTMTSERVVGYDGMWAKTEDDPRAMGSPVGELATIREYLSNYRLTLGMKCEDLSPEQLATRSVPPSTMSLLGLIRHMARVEHNWFQRVLQGRRDVPRLYWSPEDPDLDFDGAVADPAVVEDGFTVWKAQIAAADEWLDGLTDLDATPHDEQASVRDILIHMIEEYARHCGHADLLRECIDGRTGQ